MPAFEGIANLAPGKSIAGNWKAQTSPCIQHKVILATRTYLANVYFPNVKIMKVIGHHQ